MARLTDPPKSSNLQLPRGTIARVNLGQSFAEYDKILLKPGAFVETPAIKAALDPSRSKCFFVGRRGTGKTAITYYLSEKQSNSLQILPQIFAPLARFLTANDPSKLRQRQTRSLIAAFKRAFQYEVLAHWADRGLLSFNRAPAIITKERNIIEELDFDERASLLVEEVFQTLSRKDDREWLRFMKRTKDIGTTMEGLREDSRWNCALLVDRLDESWDGSDNAVQLLSALMHACVELTSSSESIRTLLFLRENIYERVRATDTEFARLETSVVSLDWSRELLLEFVERRLSLSLTAKFPLGGQTWDAFVEKADGQSTQSLVFDYCEYKPRDVLSYCALALESAQSKRHYQISVEDLLSGRRRFSENRLKDLSDEYAENYPQIQLILSRFFGLGREFTLNGIVAFIKKLLVDDEIKRYCAAWIYRFTQPDIFVKLMYDIGFFGIRDNGVPVFRASGPQAGMAPPIKSTTILVIHPSYVDALNLQNVIVGHLDESIELQSTGLVSELPHAIDLHDYNNQLDQLLDDLKTLPKGDAAAAAFEDAVGSVIKLCFFRSLSNVQPHERDLNGRVIRDWIAANHATTGFWELVRLQYGATQIIWECKNFEDLDAGAFQQAAYYMTRQIGRFVVLVFRGEVKKHYYEHVRRISTDKDGGLVLLLNDKDLAVFVRQAIKGKGREDHLRERFDYTVRTIS